MTTNPDTLPTSTDPTGPCPHCGRISNFEDRGYLPLKLYNPSIPASSALRKAVQLVCRGCQESCVVIEIRRDVGGPFEPVSWWPTPGLAGLDRSVIAAPVANAYEEGVRCLAVQAPNAAVAMLRNALAQIVQDKGSDEARRKRTLNDAIKQMAEDRTLWETFGSWAHRVRELGNAGAHQEDYVDVTLEEAEDLRSLVGAMIDLLYVQHARVMKAASPQKRSGTS